MDVKILKRKVYAIRFSQKVNNIYKLNLQESILTISVSFEN